MTHHDFSGYAGTAMLVVILLACCALIAAPAAAVTKYPEGAPSMSAVFTGVNEFTPGDDADISILVKNSGVNPLKQLGVGTIEYEDLPNTARFLSIGLASENDAIIIKTDPQMVGDIKGNGNSMTVRLHAKISTNATEGEYQLPLTLRYRYARVVDQEAADVFHFAYDDAEVTLPVTLRIKPLVKTDVVEAVPEQLSVGSEGFLDLKIQNTGPENGEKAVVKLLRNGQSPVIPADSSVYIGSFNSGETVACRYKVSIAKDAMNQTYPVDLVVTYTNREGATVSSAPTTIGVPVNAKTVFTLVSAVPEVPAGTSQTIEIQYRNDGAVTVYNAQARITPHDPVTMSDNTAFLGDIRPGQTANARYELQADAGAEPKVYSFDSNIRYRDSLGSSLESDTLSVQVRVVPAASGSSVIHLAGCVIAGIIVIIAFLVYRKTKENR